MADPSPDIPMNVNQTSEAQESYTARGGEEWMRCCRVIRDADIKMVTAWTDEIDTLLVFAGLFSAVLTAFLIESYQLLKDDPLETSIQLLTQLTLIQIQAIQAGGSGSSTSLLNPSLPIDSKLLSTTSQSSHIAVRLNSFWFSSLICSLASAAVGIVAKQWFRSYLDDPSTILTDPHDLATIYQYRNQALQHWRVPQLLSLLPTLLQIALVLFLVGLLDLLWSLNSTVAAVSSVLVGVLGIVLIILPLIPLFRADCPYVSSLTSTIVRPLIAILSIPSKLKFKPADSLVLNTIPTLLIVLAQNICISLIFDYRNFSREHLDQQLSPSNLMARARSDQRYVSRLSGLCCMIRNIPLVHLLSLLWTVVRNIYRGFWEWKMYRSWDIREIAKAEEARDALYCPMLSRVDGLFGGSESDTADSTIGLRTVRACLQQVNDTGVALDTMLAMLKQRGVYYPSPTEFGHLKLDHILNTFHDPDYTLRSYELSSVTLLHVTGNIYNARYTILQDPRSQRQLEVSVYADLELAAIMTDILARLTKQIRRPDGNQEDLNILSLNVDSNIRRKGVQLLLALEWTCDFTLSSYRNRLKEDKTDPRFQKVVQLQQYILDTLLNVLQYKTWYDRSRTWAIEFHVLSIMVLMRDAQLDASGCAKLITYANSHPNDFLLYPTCELIIHFASRLPSLSQISTDLEKLFTRLESSLLRTLDCGVQGSTFERFCFEMPGFAGCFFTTVVAFAKKNPQVTGRNILLYSLRIFISLPGDPGLGSDIEGVVAEVKDVLAVSHQYQLGSEDERAVEEFIARISRNPVHGI
ncbi:hypothetical protein C8Q75DRAFT_804987 [Abortiporus biennis]|nr:hypothetical protein C8Q75DRAFT_804987 [Abortiporus biennis]